MKTKKKVRETPADHSNENVADKDALKFNPNGGGADYVMHKDADTVWITVGEISVHISRIADNRLVNVELYPHYHEACCPALDFARASQNAKRIADEDHNSQA